MIKQKKPVLVVSLHDVTPEFFPSLQWIVEELRGTGLPVLVLKVIPFFAGRASILHFPSFLTWLEKLVSSGSELVLHGLFHVRSEEDRARRSILRSWLTQGEDEFSGLSQAEARRRLLQGLDIMERAGFSCSGFTAPTWRLSHQAFKAVKETGFSYLTTFRGVIDLVHNRHFFSPAFGHQGIENFLESLMGLGNSLAEFFLIPFLKLIRIVFHPRGLNHGNFKKSLQLVSRLLSLAEPMTYSGFLNR